MAFALYRVDTDAGRLAHDTATLRLMIRATRQAFQALRAFGTGEIPTNLTILYLRTPERFAVHYWRRVLDSPRVVIRVGVLLDVEVLLHIASGIGEKRPLGADRGAELAGLDDVVGRDRDDLGVGDRDLGLEGCGFEVLLMVLRAEVAARNMG
jgi:hypothetical protein